MDAGTGQPRFAEITSFDKDTHTAKVTLQPEGVQTGWLPILASGIGAGWGVIASPAIGDQVFVIPQEGNAEHGVIVGRCFSDQQRPPAAPSGEIWMVHSSGSFIKLTNDGTVQIKGDLHVEGKVISTDEVVAMDGGNAVHLSTHKHSGVQTGTGQSGAPVAGS
jgi:phage baseplate assembly protein gpV